MHVYSDSGNPFVVDHLPHSARRVLDVGCGCGDTARLIKQRNAGVWIEGVTFNPAEAREARKILDEVHVFDLEGPFPKSLSGGFECILFSHVLEHLTAPSDIIGRFLDYLNPDGTVVIAIPNVLEWRTRLRFLRGHWKYEESGILDRTHLKFFTFNSAVPELVRNGLQSQLVVTTKLGEGAVPLGPFRRIGALTHLCQKLDQFGVKHWPNLFSQQLLIIARRAA